MLHHVEINVRDLKRSAAFWAWFLGELGYRPFQTWDQGRSWISGRTYVVLVQTGDRYLDPPFHRRRTGLNHLAFHALSREQVDAITRQLRARGTTILYDDRHPHAGGPDSYAVFFEDPDRLKVELVAPAQAQTRAGVRRLEAGKGAVCEQILRGLPEWFGIEGSIVEYVRCVEAMPVWVAEVAGEAAGFLALDLKNAWVAEIHVMGVRRQHQGRGIGTALVDAAEADLREREVELLVVKTLGPSCADAGYARTREFYLARGFRPVEEFSGVWSPGNPCLVMAKSLAARPDTP